MTRITQGTGRNMIPSRCATMDDLIGPLQLLHDLMGNPNLRRTDELPPPSLGSVRWVAFTLTEAFTDELPNNQATANVLDLDGTDSGQDVEIYDSVGLWSSAAGTETGWGFVAKHPTSGEQVVIPICPLPGGGSGDGNDKVKVNSSDATDFLAAQYEQAQQYPTAADYNASTDVLIKSKVIDVAGDQQMRQYFTASDVNTDEQVAVDASQTAGYLEDQFNNTDLSGTIPGGTQQVFFGKTGTTPNKTLYAYTAEGGAGGGSTVTGVRPNAANIAEGASGACDIMEWSGGAWSDTTNNGTLYNLTGHTLLQSVTVPGLLVTGTTYVAVDNKSATIVTAEADGASNYLTSYAAITATSVVGWDGEDANISIGSGDLSNPLELEVYDNDEIICVGDYNGTAGKWVIVGVKPRAMYGKIGKTYTTITARSGTTVGKGTVDIYELDTSDDGITDTTDDETWYNLADESIASDTWVMGKPVQTDDGSIVWFVDWEQCSA